ncbi:hypothetical protein NFI96_020392 [Prochilodus magdalenae]|nr:hypothetical protein NFI96_020392 [Prochilodus magdalenae]
MAKVKSRAVPQALRASSTARLELPSLRNKCPDSSLSWLPDGGMNSHWASEQRSLSQSSNAD